MVKVKQCEMCGKEISYERANKRYCEKCLKARERQRKAESIRSASRYIARCVVCGGPVIPGGGSSKYCAFCRTLTVKEREIYVKQKESRKIGYSLVELAALAKQYRPPYATYGKLKSYIHMTGKLPPEEYRRSGINE